MIGQLHAPTIFHRTSPGLRSSDPPHHALPRILFPHALPKLIAPNPPPSVQHTFPFSLFPLFSRGPTSPKLAATLFPFPFYLCSPIAPNPPPPVHHTFTFYLYSHTVQIPLHRPTTLLPFTFPPTRSKSPSTGPTHFYLLPFTFAAPPPS